jgi:hypothetical protein
MDKDNYIINERETSGKEYGLNENELDASCSIIKETGIYNSSNPKYKTIKKFATGPLGTILDHNLTDNNFAICTNDTVNTVTKITNAIKTQGGLLNTVFDTINNPKSPSTQKSNAKNAESKGAYTSGIKPITISSSPTPANPVILPSDYTIDLSGVSNIYAKNSDNKWYISAVKTLPQNCISSVNPDTNKTEGHCFDINNNKLLQKFTLDTSTGLYWKDYNFDSTLKVLKNQNDINPDVCVITSPLCDKTNLNSYINPDKNAIELKTRCQAICLSKEVTADSEISYPMTYNKDNKTWEY